MIGRLTRFILMWLGISAGEDERQRRTEEKWARQREFARREQELEQQATPAQPKDPPTSDAH